MSVIFSFFIIILLVRHFQSSHLCHNPGSNIAANSTALLADRYIVLGTRTFLGTGNQLQQYAHAFHFAAVTGRKIIVLDGSDIAHLCAILHCNFPLLSSISGLNDTHVYHAHFREHYHLVQIDLKQNGTLGSDSHRLIHFARPPDTRTGWILDLQQEFGSATCIAQISSCNISQINIFLECTGHYAFRQLFPGPIEDEHVQPLVNMLEGMHPNRIKQQMITIPWIKAKRIDLAIHFRNQFAHFEGNVHPTAEAAKAESTTWLRTGGAVVFEQMNTKIHQYLLHYQYTIRTSNETVLYLVGDNVEVKLAFLQELQSNLSHHFPREAFTILTTINPRGIEHSTNKHHNDTDFQRTLALEWYLLSLSNYVIGYRNSIGASTFVSTALQLASRFVNKDNITNEVYSKASWLLMSHKKTLYWVN